MSGRRSPTTLLAVGLIGLVAAVATMSRGDVTSPPSRPVPSIRSTARHGYPTEPTTGLPAGWAPAETIEGGYVVSTAGSVVEDLRIYGDLVVTAPDVTVRRVDVVGGSVQNQGVACANGLAISDSRISTGTDGVGGDGPAISGGGYTADNVLIVDSVEGFRVGGHLDAGCGPVIIRNSFAHIVPPDHCGDWHGDALQGYDGAGVTVRNSVLWLDESPSCGGTGPFIYSDNEGTVDVDRLVVRGSGYPFRLYGPGSVLDLNIVQDPDWYGPIDVRGALVTAWSARIVTLDGEGQPEPVRPLPCTT